MLREAAESTRLALLSCHLKSGGGDGTKADIQCLTDVAVPEVLAALAVAPRPRDALLVCGDFNLVLDSGLILTGSSRRTRFSAHAAHTRRVPCSS